MTQMAGFSQSEEKGIALLPKGATKIYSVGVSTGGTAEIRMALQEPGAHIVATTLDQQGADFSRKIVAEHQLDDRVEIKIENVADPLPYADVEFDYVYARLVLHYLTKQELPGVLESLRRILKPEGSLFVVVRSTDCPDMHREGAQYDENTGLTRYVGGNGKVCFRQFHTQASIRNAIELAGFTIDEVNQYDERLFMDYQRQHIAPHTDNVIEVGAHK
jgi:cyclopropane fatty-acyl-phospholipid synthase-like methyltransferase